MTFSGFPDAGPAFYEGLEADNSKTYWLAHKAVYESAIREPMLALVDALEGEFGEARLFRPYRDVRFSADKSPYKTHQGAFTGADTAFGYYVQMSADVDCRDRALSRCRGRLRIGARARGRAGTDRGEWLRSARRCGGDRSARIPP